MADTAKRRGIPNSPLPARSREIMTFIPFGDRGSQAACEEGMGGLGGQGNRGRGAPGMGPLPSFGVLTYLFGSPGFPPVPP